MSAPQTARDVTLYKLPRGAAALPTDLTGVALFSVGGNAGETYETDFYDGRKHVAVRLSGRRLGVEEETLWMAVIRRAEGVPVGDPIWCRESELLRDCDLADSGQNREALLRRLLWLSETRIQVRAKYRKFVLACGLLSFRRDDDGRLRIWLDREGAPLFSRGRLAYQNWLARINAGGVGQKLLTLLSGHKRGEVRSMPLADVGEAIGWTGRRADLRRAVKAGIAELLEEGQLVSGGLHDGMLGECVIFERPAK